jgi:hypothetical protein
MADAALNQSKTAVLQAEIAENNQRFDRYARAAQMLDNENTAVRQAGIYLLRELALSDALAYLTLCTDLLAGFITGYIFDSLQKVMNAPSQSLLPITNESQARMAFLSAVTPQSFL